MYDLGLHVDEEGRVGHQGGGIPLQGPAFITGQFACSGNPTVPHWAKLAPAAAP